jgi:hypothetical protein
MAEVVGYVIPTLDEKTPYRVVFRRGSTVIAEHNVTSRLAGDELIAALLPTLQGYLPDA